MRSENSASPQTDWIWLPEGGKPDEYVLFCDTFRAEGNVRAKISVSGDYALYINGKLAAFGQYADFEDDKIGDEIDIGAFICGGENELRITAWHIGEDFFTCRSMPAGLWYEITVGEKIVARSHAGVRCALSPGYVSHRRKVITPQLGYSYTADLRGAGRDPAWCGAAAVPGFGEPSPRPNRKLLCQPCSEGVLIGNGIYDLGCERCGFLSLRYCAEEGARLIVAYGEHLTGGRVRDKIGGRDFTVELIASGGQDEFLGTFRRLGCRYLQVTCDKKLTVSQIGICETPYPLRIKPYRADTGLRQKIYDTAVRTLALCVHEHYEDCVWREQSQYVMDSRNQMLCGYYAFENPECARSAIGLFLHGQRENGLFELCFPARTAVTIPSFSLTLPSVVLEYTRYSRDTEAAEKAFPKLEKLMEYFLPHLDARGLYKTEPAAGIWNFYEWADGLDGAFFSDDAAAKNRSGCDSLLNAFLAIACGEMRELCAFLGNFERLFYYEKMRAQIAEGIFSVFYDEAGGLFRSFEGEEGFSALANALCILAGACPEDKRGAIADKLAFGYADWTPNTLSMDKFRYDALLAADEKKYAPAVLADLDEKYSYMLGCGATSFWETIKGEADFSGAGSLCHGWSALPVYYYRILTGNKEKKLGEDMRLYDNHTRDEYRDCILSYIAGLSRDAVSERDKVLYASEAVKRRIFRRMLGEPLASPPAKTPVGFTAELLLRTRQFTAERCRFEVMPGLFFYGILYRPNVLREKNALVFALHGGGGSSEIVGGLFLGSANYNRMAERVLKPGTLVFAPQMLLWNTDTYGSPYNREIINRRLVQLGGSITALELYCLTRCVDHFAAQKEVDASRIGVVGLSYGGMYALHLGALDPGFKSVYSSCWFSDRAKHNWHDWVYKNQEREMFDAEIASLVLPRRLFIEVALRDEVFPASDAEAEKARLFGFAEKCGFAGSLRYKEFDGTHELDTNSDLLNEFLGVLGV